MNIRPLTENDCDKYFAHISRHFAESGNGDIIFHPNIDHHLWNLDEKWREDFRKYRNTPAGEVAWQMVWIVEDNATILGHVDLRGPRLRSALHRATLGLGLEREARGKGLGRQLSLLAIEWAKQQAFLDYIDLNVFANNTTALNLYMSLGFVLQGVHCDLFRVGTYSIDDFHMVLKLRP